MDAEKLKLLEDFVASQKQFKVEGFKGDIPIEEFIVSFQQGLLWNTPNVYIDNNTVMYVKNNPLRSLIDTIIACRNHYDVSVDEILDVFRKAFTKGRLVGHYCCDINRLVLRTRYSSWDVSFAPEHLIDRNLPEVRVRDLFY